MAPPKQSMISVHNDKLIASLRKQSMGRRLVQDVEVGYSADYAVQVHEDLVTVRKTGRAKYLERPARKLGKQMNQIVFLALKNKRSLRDALLRAGKLLLDASQKEVPVDTGRLRDSGFVEVR